MQAYIKMVKATCIELLKKLNINIANKPQKQVNHEDNDRGSNEGNAKSQKDWLSKVKSVFSSGSGAPNSVKNKVKQSLQPHLTGLFRPDRKVIYYVIVFCVVLTVVVSFVFISFKGKEERESTIVNNLSPSPSTTDKRLSPAYQRAIEKKDTKRLNEAKGQAGGTFSPHLFDDPLPETKEVTSTSACGCSDEWLLQSLKRLNITTSVNGVSTAKIGASDVYVGEDRFLYGDDSKPLSYKGHLVKLLQGGYLTDENDVSIMSSNGEPLSISDNGAFIDSQNRIQPLLGDLLMSSGEVILGTGKKATNSNSGLSRYGTSDLYLTKEQQILTRDGKPTLHLGEFIYVDSKESLVNRQNERANWEGDRVFITRLGHLVDNAERVFKTPGILYSYDGVQIDNKGRLLGQLGISKRFGNTDLYMDPSKRLRDAQNGYVQYIRKSPIKVENGGLLALLNGTKVLNHISNQIVLSPTGRFDMTVESGAVRPGTLLTSAGVAYDKSNNLVTKQGGLNTIAPSDIALTLDGLVTDLKGRPYFYSGHPFYLDYNKPNDGDNYSLVSFSGSSLTDMNEDIISLNTLTGALINNSSQPAVLSSLITDYNGVVLTSSGRLVVSQSELQPLYQNGRKIFYNGHEVSADEDGQLYANGKPLQASNGEPLRLNNDMHVVNSRGLPVGEEMFTDGEGNLISVFEIDSDKPLTIGGEPININGKQAFSNDDGQLRYEDGGLVLDANNSPVTILSDGTLINASGEVLDPKTLKPIKRMDDDMSNILLDEKGNVLRLNGKEVIRHRNGKLTYLDGSDVLDDRGNTIFMGANGELSTASGEEVELTGLEELLSATLGGEVPTLGGKALLINGEPVIKDGNKLKTLSGDIIPGLSINDAGYLVDDNNQVIDPLTGNVVGRIDTLDTQKKRRVFSTSNDDGAVGNFLVSDDRALLSKQGKAILIDNKKAQVREDGLLFDLLGNPILDKNNRQLMLNPDGTITTVDGGSPEGVLIQDSDKNVLNDSGLKAERYSLGKIGMVVPSGIIVGEDGKPLLHEGLPIYADNNDSFLRTIDSRLVVGPKGKKNKVSSDGQILNEEDELSSAIFTSSNGVYVGNDSSELSLERISGTPYYKTKTGLVLDENKMPLIVNGKPVYIEGGALKSAIGNLGRAIRYKGKPIGINQDGKLVNATTAEVLKDTTNKTITIAEVVTSNTREQLPRPEVKKSVTKAPKPSLSTARNNDVSTSTKVNQGNKQVSSGKVTVSIAQENDDKNDNKNIPGVTQPIDVQKLSTDAIRRLNARLDKTAKSQQAQLDVIARGLARVPLSSNQTYERSVDTKEVTLTEQQNSGEVASLASQGNVTSVYDPTVKAGDEIWAEVSQQVNSDFNSVVEVKLNGIPSYHKLYGATAYLRLNLVYEHVVFSVIRICPKSSKCISENIDAIAVDPETGSAGIAAEVDKHLWYRYGGLFAASFLKGVGEAASSSQTRVETTSVSGQVNVTSGLSGSELLAKSLQPVGEAFIPVLQNSFNRPYTVKIPQYEPLILKFFNDFQINPD